MPQFEVWCGTRLTEHWPVRYRASEVVSGHLHIRKSKIIDNVRFEEVSFGYPRQWQCDRSSEGPVRFRRGAFC